jgi:hypothetical protein
MKEKRYRVYGNGIGYKVQGFGKWEVGMRKVEVRG